MAKILVVEDFAGLADIAKRILEGACFSVEVAVNGKRALEIWDSSFQLLMTDYSMPEMNGQQLIETIRGTKDTRPIIMTSSHVDVTEEKLLAWGGNALLPKPYEADALILLVNNFCFPT